MRILEVEADNFKLFTTKFQAIKDLDKADVVLFNGPNGYGKTSVFDILEFCLTGEIGRINKYTEELAIGKNTAGESKILIADESRPAYVKLVFEELGKTIEIIYSYFPQIEKKRASKENNPHNIFKCFTRSILCDEKEVHDQVAFLKELQLDEIGEWFDKCCFLSQDEHLQFLKEAQKSKAEAISFLFEIPVKWKEEQKKLRNMLDALNNRKKKNPTAYIVRLEEKKAELDNKVKGLEKETISGESSGNVTYHCLFEEKNIFWDQEEIHLDKEAYEEAIQEVDELLYFAEHREDCSNYLFNLPYRDYRKEFNGGEEISCIEYPLEYAYRFYNLIVQEEELEKKYEKDKKEKVLQKCIQEKAYGDINWKFVSEEKFLSQDEIAEIQGQLSIVKNLESTQGILEKTMGSLKKTRDDLMKYAKTAIQYKGIEDTSCPLCGAPYENWETLESEMKKETDVLNNLSNDSVNQIQIIQEQLYTSFFSRVEKKIQEDRQTAVSEKTYQKLQEVKKYKPQILEIQTRLQNLNILLPDSFEGSISDINEGYNSLLQSLQGKLKKIPEKVELQLDGKKFKEKYDKFYDNDEKKFLEKTVEMFRDKKKYVKFLYYNSNLKALKDTKKELLKATERKDQLDKVIKRLTDYQDAINEGIQDYKKRIIKDIEPLLHVYTAKILQQKFKGKSIFISVDEKIENIQLINSVEDKQDILYSMSSGQLSAVALAFLLCMNQVYASNRTSSILLIDDPVQTIDDVNMVGFVDLLRYSFSNRQLFVSTHEQKFEWFLRYRYAKAGKTVKIFNMKELILQEK
ncbi:MAG: AAA family ATPase [Anaerovoracaceae bacterium]